MIIGQVQPSFGMAVKVKPAQESEVKQFIEKLPYEQKVQISLIRHKQINNDMDIVLSLIKRFGKERLRAKVGYIAYTQGIFHNAPETVAKAASDADKIQHNRKKLSLLL